MSDESCSPGFREFRDAARKLKAAEDAYKAAQIEYAQAVKRLSEEACK